MQCSIVEPTHRHARQALTTFAVRPSLQRDPLGFPLALRSEPVQLLGVLPENLALRDFGQESEFRSS